MAKRFAFGPFLLDTARGTLTRDGGAVAVGQRGLRVLQALLEGGGEVVTKAELMRSAWPGLVVEDSNLSVQIAALRKALDASPAENASEWITTVPRLGYRMPGVIAVEDAQLAPLELGEPDHGGRPGIAVLPFAHQDDDPAQEYLADGVTEALITALTRYRWFSVTGRNASHVYKLKPVDARTAAAELGVRYLVEGSVRKSGSRLRISTQLVDANNAHCLWADQYAFSDADLFEVQDVIAQQVAGAVEPELLQSASLTGAHRRGGSATAWDLVAKGCWLFHHVTELTHFKARELFRQARGIDPGLIEAHLWLGRVSAGLAAYGWSPDPVQDLCEGQAAALEAVQLDSKNPYSHYSLAIVATYADEFALALRSAQMAVELSPSFALGHLVHGMAALFAGDAALATTSLDRGLSLNRYDPQNFVWHNVLALALLFRGEGEGALRQAVAALKVRPTWRAAMRTAAAANAALGHHEAATDWLRRWSQTAATPADALQPLWRRNPQWVKEMSRLAPEPESHLAR